MIIVVSTNVQYTANPENGGPGGPFFVPTAMGSVGSSPNIQQPADESTRLEQSTGGQ